MLACVDEPQKIDAVVADIETTGIVELARKLRHDPRRNRLPIVALTGRSDHPNRHAFDALVRKPVDLDDLAATIASLTRR